MSEIFANDDKSYMSVKVQLAVISKVVSWFDLNTLLCCFLGSFVLNVLKNLWNGQYATHHQRLFKVSVQLCFAGSLG